MSAPSSTATAVIPAPRAVVATPSSRRRRERSVTQYWDVFEACWRTAAR